MTLRIYDVTSDPNEDCFRDQYWWPDLLSRPSVSLLYGDPSVNMQIIN